MNKTYNLNVNFQKCEQFLSTFGKKVLHELMKQRTNEQEQRNRNEFHQFTQSKRILHFNDSNTIRNTPPIPATPSPPEQMYIEDKTFHMANEVITPYVPTSEELTKPLEVLTNIDNSEFRHPTIVSSNIVQLCNRDPNVEADFKNNNKVISMFENIDRNETLDVSWDNMFDSELLDDITSEINNVGNNINTNVLNATIHKEIITHNQDTILNKNKDKKSFDKRKSKTNVNGKVTKQSDKDRNKPPKLSKKGNKTGTSEAKITYRKEKYTKAVKRWLNDVDSHNPVDEEENKENNNSNTDRDLDLDINKQDSTKNDKVQYKMTIDKPETSNKKVIQARLVNKDGVMKFTKPKNPVADDAEITKDKNDKAIQSKKKFIPPIKSQIPVKDVTYEIITVDDRNFNKCCDALFNTEEDIIAILVYSNGFCQLNNHFTDSTCTIEGILFYTGDVFYWFNCDNPMLKQTLEIILTNCKVVISYEARTLLIYLRSHLQIDTKTMNMYDVKIGASLLDPDNAPENFSDLQKLLSFTPPYTIATECKLQKTAWYISLLKECWVKLKSMLVENQLWQVFIQIEMKLLPIIAEMEHRGVAIDISKLKSMEEMLLTRMKLVEQECYKAAGKVFQINSTVQVRSIIYDELQLDAKCNVKIRETLSGGVKSTSETMLRSLMSVHPLPKLILEYRHLHKAHATFLAGIAQQVKDGIVRPTWAQTAAATGRIASNNPNLQAIPKTPFSLVMFPNANDESERLRVNFRSVYVSRPGCSFVAADFKHIECRVFAHAAADTGLLRALTHSDDLFRVLAAQWLNKPENLVTTDERERTKRLVYASLYGAGTRKLMEILDVSYDQALQVAASFNRTFPSLKSFGRHVVSQCSQAGGRLSTICGRVRHFVNISSEDFNLRSHAERQAVNFIVQGSAADLCKIAMILTDEQLQSVLPPLEAHLLLQIHDELVWEVNDQHVHTVAGIIKRVMESCGQQCGMSVALPVAITVGKSWGDMKEYAVE